MSLDIFIQDSIMHNICNSFQGYEFEPTLRPPSGIYIT